MVSNLLSLTANWKLGRTERHVLMLLIKLFKVSVRHTKLTATFNFRLLRRGALHFHRWIIINCSSRKGLQEQQEIRLVAQQHMRPVAARETGKAHMLPVHAFGSSAPSFL